MNDPLISRLRSEFHASLLNNILTQSEGGSPSNADKGSKPSVRLARGIIERLGDVRIEQKQAGQSMGSSFEAITTTFVENAFEEVRHLRPGNFQVVKGGAIHAFDQFSHLDELEAIARTNREVATALGSDYLIKPDIVVARLPEGDESINRHQIVVDDKVARLSPIRGAFNARPILHASISCKWTLRSDRAQNARSEGLNLVKNRKGRLPHISVVTAEPLPSRIASLALGTGEIDCVYHFALNELRETVVESGDDGYLDQLDMMVDGKRLRDIADLPLDLAI